jgi:hypothetical protein
MVMLSRYTLDVLALFVRLFSDASFREAVPGPLTADGHGVGRNSAPPGSISATTDLPEIEGLHRSVRLAGM